MDGSLNLIKDLVWLLYVPMHCFQQDKPSTDLFTVACGDNQDFLYPAPSDWPTCVDRLPCLPPPLEGLPEFDHDYADQTVPEFTIEYTCKFPNKQMILREDLERLSLDVIEIPAS